jgi:hypothetical protein
MNSIILNNFVSTIPGKTSFTDLGNVKNLEKINVIHLEEEFLNNLYKKESMGSYLNSIDNDNKIHITKEAVYNFFYQMRFKNLLMELNKETININSFDDETISLVSEITEKFNCILKNAKQNKNEEIIFDDLGLPLHPLEVEVLNLVERAKKGEQIFPKYDRLVDFSVLNYLKKHYGKYLKCFGAEDDYIYQFQLEVIDSKFRQNLRIWLDRNNDNINNYIPNKSIKVNKEAQAIKNNPLDFIVKSNKINVLKVTKRI